MTTNNLLRFQWNEDADRARLVAVSWPKASARTKQFRLRVKLKDAPAMIWTTFAESKRRAESTHGHAGLSVASNILRYLDDPGRLSP